MLLWHAFKTWPRVLLSLLFPEKENIALARHVGATGDLSAFEKIPLLGKVPLPDTYALFPYWEPLVRDTIWLFKYRGEQRAAALFAPLLYRHLIVPLLTHNNSGEKPILIPMPLSRERLRERGFNQAEVLAEEIEGVSNGGVLAARGILVRNKKTEHQARLKKKTDRNKNVENSFEINPPARLAGKYIFLIDDIVTTGATSGEARRVLLRAGAEKVIVIAIAH